MSKNNIDDIFQLVRFDQLDKLKEIINEQNINSYINEYKQNLVHEAIVNESLDILKYLLKCKIDINQQDEEGKTPLHYCGLYNNYDSTKLLLSESSIDVNKKDIHGNNPMWTAVFNARGYYDIVKLLKQHNADFNSKNNSNRSALDFAKQIEDDELIEILVN